MTGDLLTIHGPLTTAIPLDMPSDITNGMKYRTLGNYDFKANGKACGWGF